jgi:glycosyltransferase involved in cell wall biosynthesis
MSAQNKVKAVSVVVPVFGDGAALPELAARLTTVLGSGDFRDWELILVNDGSPCWPAIEALTRAYPNIRGINLMRNYGQHNAVLCGIRAARHPGLITMDDDLQHPPEEIPALISLLDAGADVAYGSPATEQHGLWRDVASRLTKFALQSVMGVDVARNVSAFRAFRTELREAFAGYQSPFVSIDVLLTWGTTRFAAVKVRHDPRRLGRSQYTFRKLVSHALNMMTGFSTLPLQLASLVGFVFTLFGLAILGYVITCFFLEGRVVPGFAFLASIIAVFSGAQLFALGIVGEYLARIHSRTMDRPAYVVRQSAAAGEQHPSRAAELGQQ